MPMRQFKRYYTVSTMLLAAIVVLSVFSSLNAGNFWIGYSIAAVLIAAVPFVPIFRRGGIIGNPRLSIIIAGFLTITFGAMVGVGFLDFVQTKGGEGTRGEGSPGANMIAIAFFAAVFLCPWLLTTLRGLPLWNNNIRA